jgi:hypothetical protein
VNSAPSLVETFKINPIFFLFAAMAGAFGLVAALGSLVLLGSRPRTSMMLGLVAALGGLGAFTGGTLGNGSMRYHAKMAATSPGLSPDDIHRITEDGQDQGRNCLLFGLAAGAIPFFGGGFLGFLGFLRQKRD